MANNKSMMTTVVDCIGVQRHINKNIVQVLLRTKLEVHENYSKSITRYARLTPSCNYPRNFIAIASLVLEICGIKLKYENKQGAIHKKLSK